MSKVINPLKGRTNRSWFFEQEVFDSNGIARAIKSSEGSGNLPMVIEYEEKDNTGRESIKKRETRQSAEE
jgi:hypothetical protein